MLGNDINDHIFLVDTELKSLEIALLPIERIMSFIEYLRSWRGDFWIPKTPSLDVRHAIICSRSSVSLSQSRRVASLQTALTISRTEPPAQPMDEPGSYLQLGKSTAPLRGWLFVLSASSSTMKVAILNCQVLGKEVMARKKETELPILSEQS